MAVFTVHLQEDPYPGAKYRLVQLRFGDASPADEVRLLGDSRGFEPEIEALKAAGINVLEKTVSKPAVRAGSFMKSLIRM